MGVNVLVGDARGPLFRDPGYRQGRVVVDTKTPGVATHRVVQATGDVGGVRAAAGPHRLGRGDRRTRDEGGRLVHVLEHRVVRGTQHVGLVRFQCPSGLLDRLDVGPTV